jgi:2-haloacid dehalogenase
MTKQLENIEACVFDAYGTLFDVTASARSCADELGEIWINFSALWRKKQVEYTWLHSMMGSFSDFWHVTGSALDFTMENYNIDNADLRAHLMELYYKLDAYPDVISTLKALKNNGIKCAILSNGSRSMLSAAVRHAGLYDLLDGVYSVDLLKVYKVDPRVYQMAVNNLNIEKSKIAFVSSNPWDAVGATSFGLQVAWVNRFSQKPEKIGDIPKCEIKTLDQLPTLLGL